MNNSDRKAAEAAMTINILNLVNGVCCFYQYWHNEIHRYKSEVNQIPSSLWYTQRHISYTHQDKD